MSDKPQTACWCLACDPKTGEIGLECRKEKKWTANLLERKLVELRSAHSYVIGQPSPSNIDYYLKRAKEYADVWCQDRAN